MLTQRMIFIILSSVYSSLAQSVERMTVNHDVAGSSPAGGAMLRRAFRFAVFLFYYYARYHSYTVLGLYGNAVALCKY